jgi:hypothetical protein
MQKTIQQKTRIRYTAGNHGLHARRLLLRTFAFPVLQFRRAHLGVIERGNDISMAAQMRTQESGRATVAAAVM